MKKLLLTAICIFAAVCGSAVVCRADGEIYCAPPDISVNLSAKCEYLRDTLETREDETGRCAYFIPNSSDPESEAYTKYGRIVNFHIDDTVLYGNSDFEKKAIEIEYKDAGFEYFYITYDSYDGEKTYRDYIELYGTNQIKKAVITLDDARFANNCGSDAAGINGKDTNADFSVIIPRRKDGEGVYIYSVAVKGTGVYGGVKISSANLTPGNIFFDGMNRRLNISFENKRSDAVNMNVKYSVLDGDENICLKKTAAVYAGGGTTVYDTVKLSDIDRYGVYKLRVTAEQEGLCVTKDILFSVCVNASSGEKSIPMGIGAHFSWGRDSKSGLSIIKKAGMSYIRDTYNWSGFEAEKGVYTEPASCTEYLNNASENRFGVLIAAIFGNTLYGMKSAQYMPETDEQRQAYVNYILEMLRLNHNKIDVIEVWNEPDSSNYNPGAYDRPEVYAELLRAVSEAVRKEYPDVKIAAPSLSSATLQSKYDWFEAFLTAGIADDDGNVHFAAEYFDIVTIHHYALNYDRSVKAAMEKLDEIKKLLAKYGCGDKEIYHTEFGASNLEKNSSGIEKYDLPVQAEKLARYYLGLCGCEMGERYYIYDFSDDDFAENTLGYNLGITGPHIADVPYYAKPALLAMAHINKLIGAKKATEYKTFELDACSHSASTKHYGYEISFGSYLDDSRVTALFTDKEETAYMLPADGEDMEFFDLYGNRLDFEEENGNYILTIGSSPVFARACNTKTEVHAFTGDGCVVINGRLNAAEQSVTVKILNSDNDLIFIDETETDNNGEFKFRFGAADRHGMYTALIGADSAGEIYRFSFDVSELETVFVGAYSGKDKLMSAKAFCEGASLDIEAEFFKGENASFDMLIGYYKDDMLLAVKSIPSGKMTADGNRFTAHIEDGACPEAERVSIFIFDSAERMRPLVKNAILN